MLDTEIVSIVKFIWFHKQSMQLNFNSAELNHKERSIIIVGINSSQFLFFLIFFYK